MNILLLGATGFVGKTLLKTLLLHTHHTIKVVIRDVSKQLLETSDSRVSIHTIEGIDSDTDWTECLKGCDCIIYAAGYAHVMGKPDEKALSLYATVNTTGVLNLAMQADRAGIKRFIFISSIKVCGEQTLPNASYCSDGLVNPLDAYACSKYEAEKALLKLADKSKIEVVIIRPPLIYGPGVKGNLNVIIKWLKRGIALPFGAVKNQRSLVSVYNLSSLISTCIHHPAAANQIFLVSDGFSVSTTALLKKISVALSVPVRLVPVPTWVIHFGLSLLGKRKIAQRLLGSLTVDITKTRELLGWEPEDHMDAVLKETVDFFDSVHESIQ
ncbi:MAG: NAD-dependent epimerase/dehydratase family protein [Legionellaceae bacterium]|nr:NAD-dependent epimerase/dehydratase family protein [Legionellaceae bacterium]